MESVARYPSDASHCNIDGFAIDAGSKEPIDWSVPGNLGRRVYVVTASVEFNMRNLARAVACSPSPVLLQGPTSSGKTSLVEFLGAKTGN